MATLAGTIHGPPANFDPYATRDPAAQPLLAQGTTFQTLPPGHPAPPTFSYATARRLFKEVRLDFVYMPRNGVEGFGVSDVELSTTANLPFLFNEAPLQVTPGFAVHYWSGPITRAPKFADLPSRAYDAYLDAAWEPRVNSWLSGDVAFRIGIYSDLNRVTADAIRYTGRGLAVLSFSPRFAVKAGAWYLDRNRVKILPAGGVIWTPGGPGGDVRFEILFPNPKLACRLRSIGDTDWWWYTRGEYGGGSWLVSRAGGFQDQVDYNDYRVAIGLEFFRPGGLSGLFEIGVAWEREILYKSGTPASFEPAESLFVRGGLAY